MLAVKPLPVIADSDNEIRSRGLRDGIVYFSASAGGTLEDYMPKENKRRYQASRQSSGERGMKSAFPEIISWWRHLEDGAKYRSSEFDMFIPVRETSSLLGQFWLSRPRQQQLAMAASMLTLVWVTARGQWMAARRQYVSGCRHPLFFTLRGGIGGKSMAGIVPGLSGNWLFPSHRLENVKGSS